MKKCNKCNLELDISSFHKKKNGTNGVKAVCKICSAKWQKQHYNKPEFKQKRLDRQAKPEYQQYIRKFRLKTKYNISIEEYEEMLVNQNNSCAICKTTKPKGRSSTYFAVDHCHKTGKVRSLLCYNCNSSLGLLSENIETLKEMIKYIEFYKEKDTTV